MFLDLVLKNAYTNENIFDLKEEKIWFIYLFSLLRKKYFILIILKQMIVFIIAFFNMLFRYILNNLKTLDTAFLVTSK